MKQEKTYTLVTCTFGDDFWVKLLLERLRNISPTKLTSILIVDQNRRAEVLDVSSFPRCTVLAFEPDLEQIAKVGHDHAASLNRAMKFNFTSSHVIVLDTDCIPVNSDFFGLVENLKGPLLAGDASKHGLTHPCFMVFPSEASRLINFEEGLLALGIDTGRLVGLQLSKAGFTPEIDQPRAAPWGRGHFYLEGSLYHHGSGSMLGSSDSRLTSQVSEISERYFRRRLMKGDMKPIFLDRLVFAIGLVSKFVRLVLKNKVPGIQGNVRAPISRQKTKWIHT